MSIRWHRAGTGSRPVECAWMYAREQSSEKAPARPLYKLPAFGKTWNGFFKVSQPVPIARIRGGWRARDRRVRDFCVSPGSQGGASQCDKTRHLVIQMSDHHEEGTIPACAPTGASGRENHRPPPSLCPHGGQRTEKPPSPSSIVPPRMSADGKPPSPSCFGRGVPGAACPGGGNRRS